MLRKLLKPRHTAYSVADALVQGLRDGSIILDSQLAIFKLTERINELLESNAELTARNKEIESLVESLNQQTLSSQSPNLSKTVQDPEHFEEFNNAIKFVIEPGNPEYKSLAAYVERLLIQFNLRGSVGIGEIINIAYSRGIDAIVAGKEIHNPIAWLKRACLHIIHERSRSSRKEKGLDEQESIQISFANLKLVEEMMYVDLKKIQLAFKELNLSDRRLLQIYSVEGLSWQEDSDELALVENEPDREEILRQRGYRSLLRLRKIYETMRAE